jgi:hypothetical protein
MWHSLKAIAVGAALAFSLVGPAPSQAAGHPCNPCAAKQAQPCNPCAAKQTEEKKAKKKEKKQTMPQPCNPCAAKQAQPCNPCAAKNPCGATK